MMRCVEFIYALDDADLKDSISHELESRNLPVANGAPAMEEERVLLHLSSRNPLSGPDTLRVAKSWDSSMPFLTVAVEGEALDDQHGNGVVLIDRDDPALAAHLIIEQAKDFDSKQFEEKEESLDDRPPANEETEAALRAKFSRSMRRFWITMLVIVALLVFFYAMTR